MTPELLALLFSAGLFAGFVDSIAGGGGLIALPVLLSTGLPPQVALGTNKFQGSFGTLSAACNFIRKGEASLRDCGSGIFFTFIGAACGAWAIQRLDPSFLGRLIPVLLAAVLIYTLFSQRMGDVDQAPRMERRTFYPLFGLMLGFYDGFFGPGTGSFWMAGYSLLLGYNIRRAAGYTRIMNFTSNIVSLCLFVLGGNILYAFGMAMAAGQLIGARIGSGMAIRKGARFIRPLFIAVVGLTIARLAYLSYWAS